VRLFRGKRKYLAALGLLTLAFVGWNLGWISAPFRMLARSSLNRRDLSAAERHLGWAGRLGPDAGDTEFLWARLRRKQGRLKDVRTHLEQAARLGYSRQRIRKEEVLAMAQTGDLAPVMAELSRMLQDPGDDGQEILEAYANGCLIVQRYDLATNVLDTWNKSYPGDPFEHAERNGDAEEQYRAALGRQPDFLPAAFRLGRLLLDAHRVDEAQQQFEKGVRSPHQLPFLVGLAECLTRNGRAAEARDALQRATSVDADVLAAEYRAIGEPYEFDLAALALGRMELDEGNYAQALRWLDRALARNRHDLDALYSHAVALRALGQSEASQREFKQVVEARQALEHVTELTEKLAERTDDADLRHEIGMLYLKYGSEKTGVFWLKSALTYAPNHLPTHQALAEYYESAGDRDPELKRLAERHRARLQQQ
jgi:Tfp pilus assembly protein PilF